MASAAWGLLATCIAVALSAAHGYQYVGCYADGGDRDLPLEIARGGMTVQKCNDLCSSRKYTFFGLQAGNECFCGNSFGKHGPRPNHECDRGCSGDGNQMCGGGWRNNLYTSDFDFGLRYIGCYADAGDRDLPELAASGGMSVSRCYSLCKSRRFAYFGTQDGGECWCGNSYGKHGARSNEECSTRCNGLNLEVCGGPNRNSVYATGVSPLHLPPSTDPLHPKLRDQLAAQVKAQYAEFPKDIMCSTCLINAWRRRDVDVHSKVIPLGELNAVLATYPEKVRQKVLPLQYGAEAQTSFEDFHHQISGSNGLRRTYIGMAKRVGDTIHLAMVSANLEASLATNFNVYHRRVCRKILWIFTKCDTHQVQEIRNHDANEIALIDRAMQSEIFRLLGERLAQVSV